MVFRLWLNSLDCALPRICDAVCNHCLEYTFYYQNSDSRISVSGGGIYDHCLEAIYDYFIDFWNLGARVKIYNYGLEVSFDDQGLSSSKIKVGKIRSN